MNELGSIGALILVVVYGYYVYDIIFGDTRPQRVSFGVWTLIALLGFSTAVRGGAGTGAYVAGVNLALAGVTFGLSLIPKYGKKDHESYDYALGAIAVVTLIAWYFFNLPINIAAALAVATEFVAVWPTVRGAWRQPKTEPLLIWSISVLASLLGAISAVAVSPGFAGVAYPIGLVVVDISVAATLILRRSNLFALSKDSN